MLRLTMCLTLAKRSTIIYFCLWALFWGVVLVILGSVKLNWNIQIDIQFTKPKEKDNRNIAKDRPQVAVDGKPVRNISPNSWQLNQTYQNNEKATNGNEQSNVVRETLSENQTGLLVLFTTWDFEPEKEKVRGIILNTWDKWSAKYLQPVVFSNDIRVQETIKKHRNLVSWVNMPITEWNIKCKGPPLLADMFKDAMTTFHAKLYGFANADIGFGSGLLKTLRSIRTLYEQTNKPYLIVGRRYNYDLKKNNKDIQTHKDVGPLKKDGTLVRYSTDYYITNDLFPWDALYSVTVGRPLVVRIVLGFAFREKIDVIDATKTIESIHFTTEDGNKSSWNKPGTDCNDDVVTLLELNDYVDRGHCECAPLETDYDQDGLVFVRTRKLQAICAKQPDSF